MFRKFLHDETTVIGLKSLGLCSTKNTTTPKTLNLFATNNTTNKTNIAQNHQKQEPKTLEELFGRSWKLNLNK